MMLAASGITTKPAMLGIGTIGIVKGADIYD